VAVGALLERLSCDYAVPLTRTARYSSASLYWLAPDAPSTGASDHWRWPATHVPATAYSLASVSDGDGGGKGLVSHLLLGSLAASTSLNLLP